jgi:hypothetical protein
MSTLSEATTVMVAKFHESNWDIQSAAIAAFTQAVNHGDLKAFLLV